MIKAIKHLIMTVVLIFFLGAMTACNESSLADHKMHATETIETYVQAKEEFNYSADEWSLVQKIVDDYKAIIEKAESKKSVNKAVTTAKECIDMISKDENALIKLAKQSYVDIYLKEKYPKATASDVKISFFLGIYGDCLVAVINDNYHTIFTEYIIDYKVDGLDFSYSNGYPISVWKDGCFYDLKEAYKEGLLTRENLGTVYDIYH